MEVILSEEIPSLKFPGIKQKGAQGTYSTTDLWIVKLDSIGNIVWQNTIGGNDYDYFNNNSLRQTIDGGYIIAAYSISGISGDKTEAGPGDYDIWVIKLDPFGNIVWQNTIGGSGYESVNSIEQTFDGGYIIGGISESGISGDKTEAGQGGRDYWVIKLDALGNIVWQNTIGGNLEEYLFSIKQTTDGGYIVGGFSTSGISGDKTEAGQGDRDYWIIKLNTLGNIVWQNTIGGSDMENLYSVQQTTDGGYILGGYSQSGISGDKTEAANGIGDFWVVKLNSLGNVVWQNTIGGSLGDYFRSLQQTQDGGYILGGFSASNISGDKTEDALGGYDYWVVKLDVTGNIVWQNTIGSAGEDRLYIILHTTDGGYILGGNSNSIISIDKTENNLGDFDFWIVKLKTPQLPYMVAKGSVFIDMNINCSIDTVDHLIPGVLIKVEPGTFYGMSDFLGNYTIYLFDTGSYTISLVQGDTLLQPSCISSYNLQVTSVPDTTSGMDCALTAEHYCPRLSVGVGTPFLRRCFNNTYYFTYRNTGTLPATNAYIEVDFGNYLQPQASSIPWSTVSGNVYTFPIGNININQQGSFYVTTLLDCGAGLGSTQCVTAHIYPDSLCLPTPAGWDKSETAVSGTCVNDSLVCFTIKNRSAAGSGDMGGAAQWRLYVNDTLVTQGMYQLAGGDSIVKCFPANGKAYRLEADQNLPHPRRSKPQAIVEACGSPTAFGFVNTVPQDDEELAIETFCMTVIGSFDPNDKQVSPIGITSNKYITADDELEYLIRFQNTGTDTAFKVVIRDTIATDVLDIATLTSGASSHDYTFNIYGHGIAEWTFDNILLPDSFVNEPASHGFVQFKIRQLPGNADGTLIENSAAIYFDFNAPVITNNARNEVNEGNMPVSLFTASTSTGCPDTSGGAINVAVSGGLKPYTYQWSSGQTNASLSNLSQGVYSVTVTDEAESVFVDTINVPSPLVTSVSTQSSVSCFGGNDAAAKVNPGGGVAPYTAEWSNGNTDFTANNLSAGNYQITVADSNGCQLITSIAIQDGYQVPAGTIAGADSADINETAIYTVNAGFTYTWSVTNGAIISGQGTNSVEIDWNTIGQGTLEVAVTDSGCTQTVSKNITLIDPTGIENDLLNAIQLYPNPTNGTITLKATQVTTAALLKLYDSIGKEVLEQTVIPIELQQGVVFDLKERDQGVYSFSIKTNSGTRVMKVVKY